MSGKFVGVTAVELLAVVVINGTGANEAVKLPLLRDGRPDLESNRCKLSLRDVSPIALTAVPASTDIAGQYVVKLVICNDQRRTTQCSIHMQRPLNNSFNYICSIPIGP